MAKDEALAEEAYRKRHEKLLSDMRAAGVTVDDLARAWADMEGMAEAFDAAAKGTADKDIALYHMTCLGETEEVIRRATRYAVKKRDSRA